MQGNRLGHNCEDPVALAFIGAHVFIVEREGRVVRVPLRGGTLEAVGEVSSPAGAATDGTALWVVEFTEDGSLLRIDGDGVEKVAGGLPFPSAVAVADELVVVACAGEGRDEGLVCMVSCEAARGEPSGASHRRALSAEGEARRVARGLAGPAGLAVERGTAWVLDRWGNLLTVPLAEGGARVVAAVPGPELAEREELEEERSRLPLAGGPYVLLAPETSVRPVVAAEGLVAWIGWDGRLRRLVGKEVTTDVDPACAPPEHLVYSGGVLYAASEGDIVRASLREGVLTPFVPDARPLVLGASSRAIGWVDEDGVIWTLDVAN